MTGSHNPTLVVLSALVAAFAAFVALAFVVEGARTRGRAAVRWTLGGAAALGLGVWSLHFVGMLAYRLTIGPAPVPVSFEMSTMLAALCLATAGAAAGLGLLRHPSGAATAGAGVLLGATVVATHFVAMQSMRLAAWRRYEPPLVAAAVVMAVVGASAAAWAARRRIEAPATGGPGYVAAPLAFAAATVGTHYTAMRAAVFTPDARPAAIRQGSVLATDGLAVVVVVAAVVILGLAGVAAALHREGEARRRAADEYARLYREAESARQEAEAARTAAEESERRFRQAADAAPALIWVADADGRWSYANRAWREYRGHPPDEPSASGPDAPADLLDGLHPDDVPVRRAAYTRGRHERQPYHVEYRLRRHDGAQRWLLETGAPRFGAQGAFAGFVGLCIDITARKAAEQMQAVLLEAARRLGSSLDYSVTLRQATDLLVPAFGDFCMVRVLDEDERQAQVAAAHVDPERTPLLEELGHRFRPARDDLESVVARVLETGRPLLLASVGEVDVRQRTGAPNLLRLARELGAVSAMVLPLIARGSAFGTIAVCAAESGRIYGPADLERAELFAARAALALDNARLYAAAQRAREEAVRAAELEAQLARTRLEMLRAQLNPHFLFNALHTVAMLVRRGARDDALTGIVGLSGLLRRALDTTGAAEVSLAEELALVDDYLSIERLRYRDRLRVTHDVAPDTLDALVPSFLLQPLVENAVRHGADAQGYPPAITVRAHRDGARLCLDVHDDGPGFRPGWEARPRSGLGLAVTRERLQRMFGDQFCLTVGTRPGGGGRVEVELPFREEPALHPAP